MRQHEFTQLSIPQTNAADWFDEGGPGSLPEAVAIQPNRLKRFLDDLRVNGTELVLIDAPREAGNAGYVAAETADFVLVPYKRGGHDFRALDRTLNMCRLAGKRPYLVLNYIRPGATRVEADTRESVAGRDCDVAPVWTAYDTTSITTRMAQETDPGSPVAKEIEALYLWLAGQRGLRTTPQPSRKAGRRMKSSLKDLAARRSALSRQRLNRRHCQPTTNSSRLLRECRATARHKRAATRGRCQGISSPKYHRLCA